MLYWTDTGVRNGGCTTTYWPQCPVTHLAKRPLPSDFSLPASDRVPGKPRRQRSNAGSCRRAGYAGGCGHEPRRNSDHHSV